VSGYTREHARSSQALKLPAIETWENQYPRREYEITIEVPEYTSICPKTKLPDFGTLVIRYVPARLCVELKSLKYYLLAYRNQGIFYENAVNRILDDLVAACRPRRAEVVGTFNARGGMRSSIRAVYNHGS
jgi:7-cyano-7-deazaguanine reductase